ncbi:hypothetical protein OMP38_32460 [Cohnella ginsengisoli]|uniref:Uncharacterized protein n=1 Tax=Cohnella ginsengisoli TaxID=425004 RepID=A0A9X4QQK3_9BACL|nr:hypothetical protein [Cohnella ginsengisoli]MDG0795018.1 hypothetical protein [Cohnella ginsengisoli]
MRWRKLRNRRRLRYAQGETSERDDPATTYAGASMAAGTISPAVMSWNGIRPVFTSAPRPPIKANVSCVRQIAAA